MEQWLADAKRKAKNEAEYFVENMREIANELNIDPEWFIEEVVKNIHAVKQNKE